MTSDGDTRFRVTNPLQGRWSVLFQSWWWFLGILFKLWDSLKSLSSWWWITLLLMRYVSRSSQVFQAIPMLLCYVTNSDFCLDLIFDSYLSFFVSDRCDVYPSWVVEKLMNHHLHWLLSKCWSHQLLWIRILWIMESDKMTICSIDVCQSR